MKAMIKKLGSIFILLLTLMFCACKPASIINNEVWEKGKCNELYFGTQLDKILPRPNELGEIITADFYIFEGKSFYVYAEMAYCLNVVYDETIYLQQKEETLNRYVFLTEILQSKEMQYEMPVIKCQLGSFQIKILGDKTTDLSISDRYDYPGAFGFIAFNDATFTIRYCFSVQPSLDYFEDEASFQSFIRGSFPLDW